MSQKSTSRTLGSSRKSTNNPWQVILLSALWGLAVILLLLLLFAFLLSSKDISIGLVAPLTTIIIALGGTVGGLRCGSTLRQNGLINGALTGTVIFIVLFLLSFTLPGTEPGLLALYKLLLLAVSASVGSILAVNRRKKVKTGKLTKR